MMSLEILSKVLLQVSLPSSRLTVSTVTIVIAIYTDPSWPWVMSEASQLASKLVEAHGTLFTDHTVLVDQLFHNTIKLLFS